MKNRGKENVRWEAGVFECLERGEMGRKRVV